MLKLMEGEGFSKTLEIKHKLQKKLVNVFSQHLYNYVMRCFKKSVNYIDFQKKMLKIAEWDKHKRERSFKKFKKWCFKNNYDIEEIFEKIILYSIRTILNDDFLAEIVITKHYKSNFSEFYYKVLKKVARYYYENPKIDIIEDDNYIEDIIKTSIVVFIPLNKIVNMFGKKKDDLIIQYDFNNMQDSYSDTVTDISSCTSKNNTENIDNNKRKIVVEKETDDEGSMMYLPSEEFDIKEDIKEKNDEKKDEENDEENDEEKDTKHIVIMNNKNPLMTSYKFYKKKI